MQKKHVWLAVVVWLFCSVTAAQDNERTTLRIVGSPKGSWASNNQGLSFLRYVEVEVKNVGSAEARDIRVIATLPDGERVPLDGPAVLAKGRSDIYVREIRAVVSGKKAITASASCGNCR